MRKIDKIIIHCADTPDDKDFDIKDIDLWHKENGWDGCGYHKVIKRNGEIETGRADDVEGIHCKGHNKDSIGICLIGRRKFTKEQLKSLRDLINDYKNKYPGAILYGHNELSKKTCPNFKVKEWYNNDIFIEV